MSKLSIRVANQSDLEKVTHIESICFPSAEAATKSVMQERLSVYSKGFFVAEKDNQMVGFINGGATDSPVIEDAFFESMNLHSDNGKNLVIFGLDVHPDHQKNGYAKELMNHFIDFATKEKKKAVLLTCKEHLVYYYEKFGYVNLGVSESTHGGAKWYDMSLKLK